MLADKTGLPYPIMLVVGGAAVGFVADVKLELEPELVLVIFLPPLLYGRRVLLLAAGSAREPPADLAPSDRAINDDVMHRIERDLDLEEVRLS